VNVVWFRRDVRLADHPALTEASTRGPVLPVFVLDPRLLGRSDRRDAWMLASLNALDADLRARGGRLIVRRGEPVAELVRVAREAGATGVWWNRDFTPYARERDAAVTAACRAAGLRTHTCGDAVLSEPDDVVPARGGHYTVFTPFHRAWLVRDRVPPAPAPGRLDLPARLTSAVHPTSLTGLPSSSAPLDTLPLPSVPLTEAPPAGETAARAALDGFVRSRLGNYPEERDRLDAETTSRLSPYLRVGALTPRQVYAAVSAAARAPELERARDAFVRQLAWRDFFVQILWHAPHTRWQPLRPPRQAVRWRHDPDALAAWQEGRTGYPIVDAAMRELAATGFMPNRARMIVASFLVKHLLIDWRHGDRWFMRQLLDGDPALNGGNWQWVASVGADALPAFRIFNPVTQARRFDPSGDYVRRWVPELASLTGPTVHAPWEQGGAPGYPPPIVEHGEARRRALAAFGSGPAWAAGRRVSDQT
jgi:deoxyribodipyrimidine photo-lyase